MKKSIDQAGRRIGFFQHPLLRKCARLIHEDLAPVYARDLRKWLVIAPLIGLATGLTITALAVIILNKMWPPILELLPASSLGDGAGPAAGMRADRPDHAVPHARSGRALDGRDHPQLSRAPGRCEHAPVSAQAAGGHHHGRLWRQRGTRRAQHLRRRRHRLVVMEAAAQRADDCAWTRATGASCSFAELPRECRRCFAPHSRASFFRWRCPTRTIWRMKHCCPR